MGIYENFVAFDLETTGLNPNSEEIIEIGLVKFSEGKVVQEFSQTVNPGKQVSDYVLMLTGIKQKELDESPVIQKFIPEIKEFIGDFPVVGHNISFDISFLEKHFPVKNASYDTLKLSRIYLPFVVSHKLSTVADYLGIDYKEVHRAKEDARVSGEIFMRIFEVARNINPSILKKQLNVLQGKMCEDEFVKECLEFSLSKGLNRKSYPFEIPKNYLEHRDEKNVFEDKEDIREYFKKESLEERLSQIKMAELVDEALSNNKFLIVEASGGTGKSLAYLVPSIVAIIKNKEQMYVSSYTKNLQQQLFNKDIPLAEKITGCGINAVLRKGKSNYLCIKKFRELPSELNPVYLSALYMWGYLTGTGDIAEINYITREINRGLFNLDESCRRRNCPFYNECFYYKMMGHCRNADLVLVNHALFFTGNLNVSKVVFDEAHEMEKAATDGFSIGTGHSEIQSILRNLKRKVSPGVAGKIDDLVKLTGKVFNRMGEKFMEENDYRVGFYGNIGMDPLRQILESMRGLLSQLDSEEEDMDIMISKLKEVIFNLDFIIHQDEEDRVYYAELRNRRRPSSIEFIAAPLSVGDFLEEYLYSNLDSIVMTSATLSVGESFDFMRYILGLTGYDERLNVTSLPDTYNFREQAMTIVPRYLKFPGNPGFIEEVAVFIRDLILPVSRGTLVLFTSYKHMKGVYNLLQDTFEEKGREILIQGYGVSRSKLLENFKESKDSVLFGTSSFWQGIDVPGKALEIVVIEKLPFPNPSDPFISAKSSYLENQGVGGFSSYLLPLSVLRFKQGFGRLIRSTHDMGVVCILDKRVVEKSYGSVFLESLPTSVSIVNSSLQVKEALRKWFEEGQIYVSDFQEEW